jgi:hypothetical protein
LHSLACKYIPASLGWEAYEARSGVDIDGLEGEFNMKINLNRSTEGLNVAFKLASISPMSALKRLSGVIILSLVLVRSVILLLIRLT